MISQASVRLEAEDDEQPMVWHESEPVANRGHVRLPDEQEGSGGIVSRHWL